MEIKVAIADGRIVVTKPRIRETDAFDTGAEAVAHIAYKVVHDASPVVFDPSCDAAEANGRKGFTVDAFRRDLRDEADRIRSSTMSMAA